jgi:hypothetical protein
MARLRGRATAAWPAVATSAAQRAGGAVSRCDLLALADPVAAVRNLARPSPWLSLGVAAQRPFRLGGQRTRVLAGLGLALLGLGGAPGARRSGPGWRARGRGARPSGTSRRSSGRWLAGPPGSGRNPARRRCARRPARPWRGRPAWSRRVSLLLRAVSLAGMGPLVTGRVAVRRLARGEHLAAAHPAHADDSRPGMTYGTATAAHRAHRAGSLVLGPGSSRRPPSAAAIRSAMVSVPWFSSNTEPDAVSGRA